MFIIKGNKIQLGFDNKYPENNQCVPRQHETWKKLYRWVVLFLMRHHKYCGLNYVKMCGEQGFIALHETVHLVKFIGKGSLLHSHFLCCHATLLPTNGCWQSNHIPFPLCLRSNEQTNHVQLTPDNSNLQGKSKKVRVIGSSSYRELEENSRK